MPKPFANSKNRWFLNSQEALPPVVPARSRLSEFHARHGRGPHGFQAADAEIASCQGRWEPPFLLPCRRGGQRGGSLLPPTPTLFQHPQCFCTLSLEPGGFGEPRGHLSLYFLQVTKASLLSSPRRGFWVTDAVAAQTHLIRTWAMGTHLQATQIRHCAPQVGDGKAQAHGHQKAGVTRQ